MNKITSESRKNRNDKIVLIISLALAAYFGTIIGTYYLKIDNLALGIFREMFTIPAVLLLIILSVMNGITLSKEKKIFASKSLYSFLILILTMIFLAVVS